jgi:hypothetical protein
MTYVAKVTRLNSCYNVNVGSTITSFLIENMPAVIQAELLTHGLLSEINSESSRARTSASVSTQVANDPYIPLWTINQRGMSGEYADPEISREANNLTARHIINCRDYARSLADLGVHKQDINKTALSPFAFNHVIAVSYTHLTLPTSP